MTALTFSLLFTLFLALRLILQAWLDARQIRYVSVHRMAVPAAFTDKIPLSAHQKAADYTVTKTRFSLFMLFFNSAILLCFTLLGGLQALALGLLKWLSPGILYQMVLIGAFVLITTVLNWPFDYYRQFVLEERFGFNKMTRRLFVTDQIKGLLLGVLIGIPLLWVVLTLMAQAGNTWWLYVWLVWSGFQLLMLVLYPAVIAPLFNKFEPLADINLKNRIEILMGRVGFRAKGLFVMDGSKRSAHGNAYFSGFGSAKRIVFFDTLLARLAPHEIEAVLAHELGHFKLKHIVKRISIMLIISFGLMALLGFLKNRTWFFSGLGIDPLLFSSNDAVALILFGLVLPIFTFMFAPLFSLLSRQHEFEADAFAAQYAPAVDLVSALVKMYEDNASTLTPDPLYSAFHDSHPSAATRINKLLNP